ncbi:MAG TPA: TlpA disulfide reductase family protein [Bryobacteraceae bacterium]|nr:TlpA disulfide reductase family protein [Bryobacteraceae bacterium]
MKVLALLIALAVVPAFCDNKLIPIDEPGIQRLLSANKGRVVLVNFWATWCEPCRAEVPRLVQLESRLQAKGLKLILISADEQEATATRFLQTMKVPSPSYLKRAKNDEDFINSFDPKWSGALPAMFLYNRSGKRVKAFIGETDMATVEAAVKPFL